jgi:ketosteroid isomerase-like protein
MLDAWEHISFKPEEYRELDDERVLVLLEISGRGKMSGVQVGTKGAGVCHVGAGRITRIVSYWDRERAFADLGLVSEGTAAA